MGEAMNASAMRARGARGAYGEDDLDDDFDSEEVRSAAAAPAARSERRWRGVLRATNFATAAVLAIEAVGAFVASTRAEISAPITTSYLVPAILAGERPGGVLNGTAPAAADAPTPSMPPPPPIQGSLLAPAPSLAGSIWLVATAAAACLLVAFVRLVTACSWGYVKEYETQLRMGLGEFRHVENAIYGGVTALAVAPLVGVSDAYAVACVVTLVVSAHLLFLAGDMLNEEWVVAKVPVVLYPIGCGMAPLAVGVFTIVGMSIGAVEGGVGVPLFVHAVVWIFVLRSAAAPVYQIVRLRSPAPEGRYRLELVSLMLSTCTYSALLWTLAGGALAGKLYL